jgi:hypothetical protein
VDADQQSLNVGAEDVQSCRLRASSIQPPIMQAKRIFLWLVIGVLVSVAVWLRPNGNPPTTPSIATDKPAVSKTQALVSWASHISTNEQQRAFSGKLAKQADPLAKTIEFIIARVRELKAETDLDKCRQIMDELLPLLNDGNVATIIKALPADLLDSEFGNVALKQWAGLDRQSAAQWMATGAGANEFQAGLITYGWLQEDKVGMHAYLDGLPAGAWRENVLNTAANNALTAGDGLEAIEMARKMSPGEQQDTMLKQAAEAWAKSDPQAAASWANGVTDPQLRGQINESIAAGLASVDPAKAADLVTKSMAAGEQMTTAIQDVASTWGAKDPAAAASWVANLPEGQTRGTALQTVLLNWGLNDLAATRTWVDSLQPGMVREDAEAALAKAGAALHEDYVEVEKPVNGSTN